MRIISLLPSATEILYALGLGDQVVGVTHSCDYPEAARRLPRVTSTRIPTHASSCEIDHEVRTRHRCGTPIYDLDLTRLEALRPDLLITQGLCDVCAVSDETALAAAAGLPGSPRVLNLAPATLDEVFANILEIGWATGRATAADALVIRLRRRVKRVTGATSSAASRPRVTLLEWVDPLYACGLWTPELVTLAGGTEGHGRTGQRSRLLEWDEIVLWQPEVLILACCGFDPLRAEQDLLLLEGQPGFRQLPCVQSNRTFLVDGAAYFSRPGPRLVDSLELLAHLLHPNRAPRLVQGLPWRQWRDSEVVESLGG